MEKDTDTDFILVETVSMFRIRYVIEVPRGKSDYALDTVTMQEATEFSQKHLDETIVSHRPITLNQALLLCNNENDYAVNWTDTKKIETFFTPVKD